MYPEVWKLVVTNQYPARKAVLNGYARRAVINEEYPGIIRVTGEKVKGLVYENLLESDLKKLDEYEGNQYVREPVTLELENGKSLDAFTYVFADDFLALLSDAPWDEESFKNNGLIKFKNHLREV